MHNLSKRLLLCSSFVRKNAKIVDIGTDHAYLPVFLAEKGLISSAIAADINELPLQKGADNIKKHGLCNIITTRLSNGFSHIEQNEFDDAIIAGMGGELICSIIENDKQKLIHGNKRLILQPMTRAYILREYLYKNNFEIICEKAVVSEGRSYTVIVAEYNENASISYTEADKYIGTLDFSIEADKKYILGVLKGLEAKLKDKKTANETEKIISEIRGKCNDKCSGYF